LRTELDTIPEYIESNGFIAEVNRTHRVKTATIKVEAGAVSVVVPIDLSSNQISNLLAKKNRWIKEKIILHRDAQPVSDKQYISGESFSYLGRNYRLKVNKGRQKPVVLSNGRFVVTAPNGTDDSEMIRAALTTWYENHAETKFKEKSKRYAKVIGVDYSSVEIKNYKSRWGSCSTEGHIKFNWKIIMAPNRIVDYVVVHELCHLMHHDHSPKFWKSVERMIPDYASCKEWLKDNGMFLEL